MISSTKMGIFVGAILVLAWIAFGFWPFVLVALAMIIGGFVGRIVDGKLDLIAVGNAIRGKRSSS